MHGSGSDDLDEHSADDAGSTMVSLSSSGHNILDSYSVQFVACTDC